MAGDPLNPFGCDGYCHRGETAAYDHFCDTLATKNPDLPAAFGGWLQDLVRMETVKIEEVI